MPETSVETPAEKTMRQWYQGKLAERLMQAVSLERNRSLLRRGVRKMQDGNLGKPVVKNGEQEEEAVNIHIGDQVFTGSPQSKMLESPSAERISMGGKFAKAATMAAALVGASGLGAGLMALMRDPPPAADVSADTDTQYELHIGVENPLP